jgi:hypothetical protein
MREEGRRRDGILCHPRLVVSEEVAAIGGAKRMRASERESPTSAPSLCSLCLSKKKKGRPTPRTSPARPAQRPFGPARGAGGRASRRTDCPRRARGRRRARGGARPRTGRSAFSAVETEEQRLAGRSSSPSRVEGGCARCEVERNAVPGSLGWRSSPSSWWLFVLCGLCVCGAREAGGSGGGKKAAATARRGARRRRRRLAPRGRCRRATHSSASSCRPPPPSSRDRGRRQPTSSPAARLSVFVSSQLSRRYTQQKLGQRPTQKSGCAGGRGATWVRGDASHPLAPPPPSPPPSFTGSQSRPTRAWRTPRSPPPKGSTSTCPAPPPS